jgi:hypothetical protein
MGKTSLEISALIAIEGCCIASNECHRSFQGFGDVRRFCECSRFGSFCAPEECASEDAGTDVCGNAMQATVSF